MNGGIQDLKVYLARMQKAVLDKMFFVDKIFEPVKYMVDFGCADGELFRAIRALFGDEYAYVGYDINPDMIAAARKKAPFARFTTDWETLGVPFDESLLNLSSTLHEVYSYCSGEEIDKVWRRVFDSGFKYVTIRDMMLPADTVRAASPGDLDKIRAKERYREHLRDYEEVWGPLATQKDLVHYLLKYSYTENWEREVREDYLGFTPEEFQKRLPDGYEVCYYRHFTLPYTAWRIQRDFGIDLKTPTHVKMILKKR